MQRKTPHRVFFFLHSQKSNTKRTLEMFTLYNGDCLDVMATLPDKSIDFICCDLPYGTTKAEWDIVLPFDKLWTQYERLITDTGSIALFASGKFLPAVLASNPPLYRYMWIWVKNTTMLYVHAHNRPMTRFEAICMFSHASPIHDNDKNGSIKGVKRMLYNPQGLYALKNVKNRAPHKHTGFFRKSTISKQEFGNYPSDVLFFNNASKELHPTEKPVDLLMYLVKTYTNKGMTVLDNCMGSGSCGEACIRTGRNFIGIEKDKGYFNVAENRLKNLKWQGGLLE
jgi:site-specific DNA-methyltransferase (adenine-specific)